MSLLRRFVHWFNGPHVPHYHGNPFRFGKVDRWFWTCSCGKDSQRIDMTVKEAMADWEQHATPPSA